MITEIVEAEGHLIDSGNLQAILTTIVEHPADHGAAGKHDAMVRRIRAPQNLNQGRDPFRPADRPAGRIADDAHLP